MKVNQAGIDLIKSFEGCRLKAYKDCVGIWTIGYGHIQGVVEGMRINQKEADNLLAADIEEKAKAIEPLIKIKISDNSFSALVSFAFNVGVGALKNSTLLKRLNAARISDAALEFLRWNKAGGKVVEGLSRRRRAERDLFLKA